MTGTPRLALPFLSAGQAQKEWVHNEALQILDIAVAAAVEDGPISTPPASPPIGACFIVAADPTDAWTSNAQAIACSTEGGWRFVQAFEGLSVYSKSQQVWATYRAGAWETGILRGSSVVIGGQQVVGSRSAAIAGPTGGAVVDDEARGSIGRILDALRQHGLIES
jgi:hypothetical protein